MLNLQTQPTPEQPIEQPNADPALYDPEITDATNQWSPDDESPTEEKQAIGLQRYYEILSFGAGLMILNPDTIVTHVNDDGGQHVTIYSPEDNTRVSLDTDEKGNEIPDSCHYTNQNVDKGDDSSHSTGN
jgi:hypothetical protein